MEERGNKLLDELSRKLMQESSLESPTMNFTSKVLQNLEGQAGKKAYAYTPLIRPWGWLVIAGMVLFYMTWLVYTGVSVNMQSLTPLFSSWNIPVESWTSLQFRLPWDNGLVYGTIIFTVMLFAQIGWIKSYYDRVFLLHKKSPV